MPWLIERIDAIAHGKARAVLYLEFHPHPSSDRRCYRFEKNPMRGPILAWLDAHHVASSECGPFAEQHMLAPYLGQIYLDITYEESLPEYRVLRDYLEHQDGTMRHEGVRFRVMPLDYAMRNADRDSPGYWERWAGDC